MNYIKATTLNGVRDAVKGRTEKVYFLAGGTDLMVYQRERLLPEPNLWVDLGELDGLRGVKERKETVVIGPLTTYTQLMKSPVIRKHAPILAAAAGQIGGPAIRNRGTVGGNLGNASPAGDALPALFALDAQVELMLGKRNRTVEIGKFFLGPKKSVLENGELITAIVIPKQKYNFGAFVKLGPRRALAIAKLSLALTALIEAGRFSKVRIACGAVGPTVIRAKRTEDMLRGKELTPTLIEKASKLILAEICPITDFRSSAEYRYHAIGALLKKALRQI